MTTEQVVHCPLDIANLLAKRFGYETYLEIGIRRTGDNFDHVQIPVKHGVDIEPKAGATFTMSSDRFFIEGHGLPKYDLIYVDGDHRELPALRDMVHSLDRLAVGGTILCDNVIPTPNQLAQVGPPCDTWKAWAYLRMSRPDLRMVVVDIPFGCGIVRRGRQNLFVPEELPYKPMKRDPCVDAAFYTKYREKLLRIVSPEWFMSAVQNNGLTHEVLRDE